MNKCAKILLASTSLCPVLFIVGVNQFERCKSVKSGVPWLVTALVLIILCWWLLRHFSKKAGKHLLHICEFERKDHEMLAFLFIYILPFIRSGAAMFASEWITSVCLLIILSFAITHARAFHFNPIMGFFGYRFYSIKDSQGVSKLLISKENIQRVDKKVKIVQLTSDVYLQTEGKNA